MLNAKLIFRGKFSERESEVSLTFASEGRHSPASLWNNEWSVQGMHLSLGDTMSAREKPEQQMSSDARVLKGQNVRIGEAESSGDCKWLASVLAPELAFFRADGKTFDNAGRILQKVKVGSSRATEVESIEILGNRAIAKCIVTQDGKKYHNLHLFVRYAGDWLLLAWANEEIVERRATNKHKP